MTGVFELPAYLGKNLLTHVAFVNKARLLTALRTSADLLLGSDGGASNLKGSFGALLADDKSILLECGGRAYGADPKSFCSEGCTACSPYCAWSFMSPTFTVKYTY
jgi:hypothetical protein